MQHPRTEGAPGARDLSSALRHLTTAALVEKVCTFASGLLLLRYLPLRDYGALGVAYGTYTLVNFAVGLGLNDLVVARCSQARGAGDEASHHRMLGSFLFWWLAGLIAAAACGAALRPVLVPRAPEEVARAYFLVVVAGLTTPIRNLVITIFRVEHDFAGVKRTDIARAIGLTAGYAVFIGWAEWGLAGALLACSIANALPLLTNPRELGRIARPAAAHLTPAPLLELLGDEGKWQIGRQAVTTLHSSTRPWLIQLVLGLEAVGLFNAAKTVLGIAPDLLPIKEALIPMMSAAASDRERLRALYADSLRYATAIFAALAVGIIIVSPWVFAVLFPKYHGAVVLIQIMAVNVITAGFATPQGSMFYALRLQRDYFATAAANFLLMLTVTVPLMFAMGVTGLAVGFVIGGAAVAWMRQRQLQRVCPAVILRAADWLVIKRSDAEFLKALLLGR